MLLFSSLTPNRQLHLLKMFRVQKKEAIMRNVCIHQDKPSLLSIIISHEEETGNEHK